MVGTKDYGNMLVNVKTEYNDWILVIENANVLVEIQYSR